MNPIVELTTQQKRLRKAMALVAHKELKTAQGYLQTLLAEFPHFFQGWIELGRVQRRVGKRTQALASFEMAQKIAPNHPVAAVEIAVELESNGRLEAAVGKLDEAAKRHPENVSVLFNLGLLYKKQQRREDAIATFQQAVSLSPDHFRSQFQLALLFRESGQMKLAESTMIQLSTTYPKSEVYFEIGLISRHQGDRPKALSFFEQAERCAQSPAQTLEASFQAAVELYELGELAASSERLATIIAQRPDDEPTLQMLVKLCKKQRKTRSAIDYCQQLIALNSNNVAMHIQLSDLWRSVGDYDKAQHFLEVVLSNHPTHLNTLLRLAALACEQRSCDRALAYCTQASKAHPTRLEPLLKKAEVLLIFSQIEQARILLERLLKDHPKEPRLLLKLGHLERHQGQRQQALHWFRQMAQQANNVAEESAAQLLIAEELRALNCLDEAVDHLEQFLQKSPNHLRAQMAMAAVFQEQLNYRAAESVYRSAIALNPDEMAPQLGLAKVLSETYRVPAAIAVLEDFYQCGHQDFPVMMQLGDLSRAEEDWDGAYYWYKLTIKFYPYKAPAYRALSDVLYSRGEIDAATALLTDACERLPDVPEIALRLATLKLRLGLPNESLTILQQLHQQFPLHLPTILHLCRLRAQQGQFDHVNQLLQLVDSDQRAFLKQIAQIKGNMALSVFDLATAIQHFQQSVEIAPTNVSEYQRLALALMLSGKVDQAYTQLVHATQEQHEKRLPGKKGQPIASHTALLINQIRVNPSLMAELQKTQSESSGERLRSLGSLVAREPAYLGSAAFLCKELRCQNIFSGIRDHLSIRRHHQPSIPKRIVQYWDEDSPPESVLKVGHSWRSHNPDYEYKRFSFESAVEFLRSHYDTDVIQAFHNCDHPATESDLFRLAYINKMGGFYADADDRCLHSLDELIDAQAELIVYQEDNACIGNNFIGCLPGQSTIRTALYQAVANLSCYNNEGPWLQTGPGLLTTSLCSHLLPYLSGTDYRSWPRIAVFKPGELRKYVWWGLSLPYKQTLRSWQKAAYDGPA